jgi:AcrR family transcriptional regulator
VRAAVSIVVEQGPDKATIRNVASRLGVSPMSLYRHVSDKTDLLDEVVDQLFSSRWRPTVDRSNWRAWIHEAADGLRRFLVEQPVALEVYLAHPVVSATARARMQAMVSVLNEVLGDHDRAREAYAALHTYTIGFAALESSRAAARPKIESADELTRELAAYSSPDQFAAGLDYLLDGLCRARPGADGLAQPHRHTSEEVLSIDNREH